VQYQYAGLEFAVREQFEVRIHRLGEEREPLAEKLGGHSEYQVIDEPGLGEQ
jgi:hypothetical protein